MKIPVNEVFATIQGEAHWTGTPSIFVRLQGCAVGCAFCDTKHTWACDREQIVTVEQMIAKRTDAPTWTEMEPSDLATLISTAVDSFANHVVITGGEPADYDLHELTTLLHEENFTVQVETSGTAELRVDPRTWVTVSPKIDQAGGKPVLPVAMGRANEIKHPTATQKHVDALMALLAKRWHQHDAEVWLQPLSQSPQATKRCIDWCFLHGWKLSVQTHKYIGVR